MYQLPHADSTYNREMCR